MYRRNSDEGLRRLQRAADAGHDPSAIPQYLAAYLRTYGCFQSIPPYHIPEINWYCDTHQRTIYIRPGQINRAEAEQCPKTIWYTPPLGLGRDSWGRYVPLDIPCCIKPIIATLENWINWIPHTHNLFGVKKDYHPEPTTPEVLLQTFADLHSQHPAFQLLREEVLAYLRGTFGLALQILSELRILPDMPRYPLELVTWQELVEMTNLRADLVLSPDGRMPLDEYLVYPTIFSRNSLSFAINNFSPMSLLAFAAVDKDSRGQPWVTNTRLGIIVNTHSKEEVWPVRLAYYG